MDILISVIMLIIFLTLAILVKLRKIPPISTEYLTSQKDMKIEIKNSIKEINFIASVFFASAIIFLLITLMIIFKEANYLKYIAYASIALLLIYVFYKNILSEIEKAKKNNWFDVNTQNILLKYYTFWLGILFSSNKSIYINWFIYLIWRLYAKLLYRINLNWYFSGRTYLNNCLYI